jgi:hypothetical protein
MSPSTIKPGSSSWSPSKGTTVQPGASQWLPGTQTALPKPPTSVLGLAPGTPGSVRILCPDKGFDVTCWCGGTGLTITGGYGGVSRVQRPRRVSSTDYAGIDPYTASLPVRFDGWADDRSVEPECAALDAMARDPSSRVGPPGVQVLGPVPPAYASIVWLIDDVQWGDALWSDGNYRTRQDATINLVQFVAVDTVALSPAERASAAAKASASSGTSYVASGTQTAFGAPLHRKPSTSLKK